MSEPSPPSPQAARFAGARSALQKIRHWWSLRAVDVAFYAYSALMVVLLVLVGMQLIH